MSELERNGNLIEAGLWFVVTMVLLTQGLRARGPLRRVLAFLTVAFFVFGISDLIEARTGAWWRPFWLLLMKSGCVGTFMYGFREYYRIKKRPGA